VSTATEFDWTQDRLAVTTDLDGDPETDDAKVETLDEEGNQTRTFTTYGTEPGDKQELEITSELDREEETKTTYDSAIDSGDTLTFLQGAYRGDYETVKDQQTNGTVETQVVLCTSFA